MAYIVNRENQYWIYNKPYYNPDQDILDNPEEFIWYTIRDYKNSASSNGYKLEQGDILKFGRARVKVVKICLDVGQDQSEASLPPISEKLSNLHFQSTVDIQSEAKQTDIDSANTCRICFGEAEPENPLISVCKCSGSMKYIHQKCLAGWIDSKKAVKSSSSTITFLWKSFECELCKETYSEALQARYNLISYENPFQKYVVLEGQCGTCTKNIYIINLEARRDQFKIGRGHESDIRISDISVSRLHATLSYKNGNLIVED